MAVGGASRGRKNFYERGTGEEVDGIGIVGQDSGARGEGDGTFRSVAFKRFKVSLSPPPSHGSQCQERSWVCLPIQILDWPAVSLGSFWDALPFVVALYHPRPSYVSNVLYLPRSTPIGKTISLPVVIIANMQ